MEAIKKFFGLKPPYKLEWNDLRAFIQLVNVTLIIIFGLSVSWFGLAIAIFGLCKDLSQHRHVNDVVLHLTGVILNIHFLVMYLTGA